MMSSAIPQASDMQAADSRPGELALALQEAFTVFR